MTKAACSQKFKHQTKCFLRLKPLAKNELQARARPRPEPKGQLTPILTMIPLWKKKRYLNSNCQATMILSMENLLLLLINLLTSTTKTLTSFTREPVSD